MSELAEKQLAKLEIRLRTEIQAAQQRGDAAAVAKLQAEYRSSGIPVVRDGPVPQVRGGSAPRPRPVRSVSKPAKRKPATTSAIETPQLRADVEPKFEVELRPGALDGIIAELQRSDGLLDVCETGGTLIGTWTLKKFTVTHATAPAMTGSPGTSRTR
jgi:hypothetical protein